MEDRRSELAELVTIIWQIQPTIAQDDILDVEGDTATLGKRQGADIARDKPTYPALLGLDAAKAYAIELRDHALVALEGFGEKAGPLRALARYIVERRN